jgi:hypothetical protein
MKRTSMIDQLTLRIKSGYEQALVLFFRKYYVQECSFVNKFLNDPEETHEIVQFKFF